MVASICTHYGHAVYDPTASIVAEARDRELAWCSQQPKRPDAVAQHILDRFPVSWSYTHLDDDVFALVRTCYRGYCPDFKPGNFFSHALVFRPENLLACGGNPLALSRTGIFASHDPHDATDLPEFESLPEVSVESIDWSLLGGVPWRDQVPAMLTALTDDPPGRPVVLCMADWRMALPLVEGLLSLLPPSMRVRTTFATYETDRHWVVSASRGRPHGPVSAHQVMALCSSDDRVWSLFADDYRSQFAVFNSVGNRYSEMPPSSAFAPFAAECVRRNQRSRLSRLHEFIEQLGLGRSPASWEYLVAAFGLVDSGVNASGFRAAVRSLMCVPRRPEQATEAVSILMPWATRLAQRGETENLALLRDSLKEIAERLDLRVRDLLHEYLQDVFVREMSELEHGRALVGRESEAKPDVVARADDPAEEQRARSEPERLPPHRFVSRIVRRLWEALVGREEGSPHARETRDHAENEP